MSVERWACALAAPIRRRAGMGLEGLSGGREPRSGKGDRFCREQLRDVASIQDRDDVLEKLPMYVEGVGRIEYAKMRKWHAELPKEAESVGSYLLDPTERMKRVFVQDHAGRPEETSVAAWDCARLVHYAGLAYGAGYLAEHEAWAFLLSAARTALAEYSSWEEYSRGYVYGRWFWQGYWEDNMKETARVVQELLEKSPGFRDCPWPHDASALVPLEKLAGSVTVASPGRLEGVAVRAFVDCPACLQPILLREASNRITCDACGETNESAALDLWKHVLADEDEDEDEDEPTEDEVCTNLGNQIERFLKRPAPENPVCTACREPLASASGPQHCACGRTTPVLAAPDWMREINPRLRFVVGGPLALGRPNDFFQLLFVRKGGA